MKFTFDRLSFSQIIKTTLCEGIYHKEMEKTVKSLIPNSDGYKLEIDGEKSFEVRFQKDKKCPFYEDPIFFNRNSLDIKVEPMFTL